MEYENQLLKLTPGGLPTVYGVFKTYQDQCAKRFVSTGWNDQTTERYEASLCTIILPHLEQHNLKSVAEYKKEELDKTIQEIRLKGKKNKNPYDDKTIEGFQRLLETIFYVASENRLCVNIYEEEEEAVNLLNQLHCSNLIPKSLSPKQELDAVRTILGMCMENGKAVALLLMCGLGLRCAEACGATFGNIHEAKVKGVVFHYLSVVHTTEVGSNQMKLGGKTSNAVRYIPMPDALYDILMQLRDKRCQTLKRRGGEYEVDQLTLACRGDDPLKPCSTADISTAGKELFCRIGIRNSEQSALKLSMLQEAAAARDISAEEEFSLIEKDVTTYIFRRNFATHLVKLGLEETEQEYLIGHKLENELPTRIQYANHDMLYDLKQKLDQRPIFNNICETTVVYVGQGEFIRRHCNGRTEFVLPPDTPFSARFSSLEPGVPVYASISSEVASLRSYQSSKNRPEYGDKVSVVAAYHRYYRKTVGDYVIHLE